MQQTSTKGILAQKEYDISPFPPSRADWVGKVIYRELCKRLKFGHTTKWYIHKPDSVLENDKYKILWDFEIQINQ